MMDPEITPSRTLVTPDETDLVRRILREQLEARTRLPAPPSAETLLSWNTDVLRAHVCDNVR